MPENHDERDEFDGEFNDDPGGEFGDDKVEDDWAWPRYPPARAGSGNALRRGLLLAAVALVAAGAAYGVAEAAIGDVSGSPAASATPSAGAPSSGTGGTPVSPPGGGLASLPPGAMEQIELGGPVTAVSASSITIGGGSRAVTAAVTSATKVTGKVTSIRGIKVGDLVSASITGTSGGKLTATSIQDPASLSSGPGQ